MILARDSRASLLAACALGLLALPSAAQVAEGDWTGQTNQGLAYSFKVQGGKIVQIAYAYNVGCGSSSATINGSFNIAANAFDTQTTGFCPTNRHTGTFATPSTASGQLVLTWTPIPGVCFCGGTTTLTWTATGPGPANTPPVFTPAAPGGIDVVKGSTVLDALLGTVNDAETAPGSLVVELTSTATGFTIADLTNTAGAVTADITVDCSTPVVGGAINLKVTDGGGLFVSPAASVNVLSDVVVTPPSPVTVNQTACPGGAPGATLAGLQSRYPTQGTALAAFLAGGSAATTCFPPATAQPAQVSGTDVTASTVFPAGTTPVTFRFRDAQSNLGTAPANVIVRRHGDLDLNALIDIFDIVTLSSYIVGNVAAGSPPFTGDALQADYDGDGDSDIFDLVLLAAFVVGNSTCLTP